MIKEFFKTILYEPLFNLLVFFAFIVPGHSIGWAIILLTILVRALLWVPSVKSLKAPLQLRQHQGEIKELQERYKDDRQAQAQAVMAFYREKGINPLSGCLTLLIQLPVIFILYRVFMVGLHDLRPDLLYSFTPHLDSINTNFFGINLAEKDPWILPLIAGAAQYLQSRHYAILNPSMSKGGNDPTAIMNKQMQYFFPIMTFIIGRSLPAGLSLYWAASTIFSWLQQLYLEKTFKAEKPRVSVSVRSKKS